MSYFIFPAQTISHGLRPRNTYASILTDVVRASADSIDALLLFQKLLLGEGTANDDVGFTAYDAHVGDTSCQLRAAMVLDLFKHHRRYAARASPAWIDQVVEKLQDVQNKARKTLAQLTIERVHPFKLGIGARQDTPEDILKALGWSELDLPRDAGALYPGLQTRTQEARPTISKRRTSSYSAPRVLLDKAAARLQHDTQHMFGPGLHHSDKLKNAQAGAQSHLATAPAESSRTYSTTSPLLGESEPGAAWNPFDVRIITRFLVYSYVLSKYKSFRRFKHVVGARLYPEAAIGYGDGLVEEVIDKKTPDYKHSKATRRVDVEFAALQTWVSEMSCAWLQAIATHSNAAPYAQRLITDTIRTSDKNLTSAPSYLGFLLLREMWGRDGDSIILVDRRFCSEGFHSNFFIATLRLEKPGANYPPRPAHCLPLSHAVSWHLEYVTPEWLRAHPDRHTPHIVIMGNSINGCYEDYMAASSPDKPTGTRHSASCCADNEEHVQRFLDHDHDRLALCFFARHKHYTFELPDPAEAERGEGEVVARVMERHFAGLERYWKRSDEEAEEVGTGRSLKMFSWQHALLETKGRIASMVMESRTTMPISAKVL